MPQSLIALRCRPVLVFIVWGQVLIFCSVRKNENKSVQVDEVLGSASAFKIIEDAMVSILSVASRSPCLQCSKALLKFSDLGGIFLQQMYKDYFLPKRQR